LNSAVEYLPSHCSLLNHENFQPKSILDRQFSKRRGQQSSLAKWEHYYTILCIILIRSHIQNNFLGNTHRIYNLLALSQFSRCPDEGHFPLQGAIFHAQCCGLSSYGPNITGLSIVCWSLQSINITGIIIFIYLENTDRSSHIRSKC